MDLEEWTIQYVKHKDLLDNMLENYEKQEDKIRFNFEHMDHDYYIQPKLSKKVFDIEEDTERTTIVCRNEEENVDFMMQNWKEFTRHEYTVIFVNPESNNKWIIQPHVHDRVADNEHLEEGLQTMFEQSKE